MIHRAKFQNFKALRDVEVTFDSRLTVLVGPNGSGKTSVLEGIRYYCQTDHRQANPMEFRPLAELLRSKNPIAVASDDTSNGWDNGSTVLFGVVPRGSGEAATGIQLTFNRSSESPEERGASSDVIEPRTTPAAIFLRLKPSALAEPSVPNWISVLSEDGSGLASIVAAWKLSDADKLTRLIGDLRAVIPNVEDLRVVRVPLTREEKDPIRIDNQEVERNVSRQYIADQLLYDFTTARGVPASMVSEGTLLITGLLVALASDPRRDRVVLMDDIDRGLHPRAQMKLVEALRATLAREPGLQIIATCHSPYILHQLEPEEVRLLAFREDGTTTSLALADHPDFNRWKDAMTPGEFWTHVGEDWVKRLPDYQAAS